ncbi:MAG: Isoprenyl transferase [Candidatus Woesebacteria bacterium GW2011_GWA1_45_8]|uniref:Isoprenyl transferase n=1 Tax=Candidatus Woesebacteria bacterium GW2011_GWA1_45_8 TaxID=1618559 RepID=A0A0G1MVR6_9BACT|nr:MAG: Isoprenyl transferase [Candidatus Woesebacteria bacterium GW2011_GWA1_45_8]
MPKSIITLPKGTKVPDHIALILDGNRRWARARGLKPWEGHKAGYDSVRKLARAARELGVHTFTIWAFSTENWERPRQEIDAILSLLKSGLKEFEKEAHKERVRLIHLGRKDRFPEDVVEAITNVEDSTKKYSSHILNLALDYGGKDEILRATKRIVESGISADKIDEKLFESYLDTSGQPYPYVDLFIRTSGEQRTSGLLPWQMTYAEYYWDQDHLPDFTPEKLKEAILDFSRRRRRFGGNDSVEHLAFDPEVVANLELSWWRLRKIPEGTRFRDYAMNHIREQFGLTKSLAKAAAKYMIEALHEEGNGRNWERAISRLKKFYQLIKEELKLAFEPAIVASLQVKFWRDVANKEGVGEAADAEETARKLYAEVYRISLLQAAKAAHLRVLANIERNLAERGFGEHHWKRAEDYLHRFYSALKERVA